MVLGRAETGFEGTDLHQLTRSWDLNSSYRSEVHRNCRRDTSSCHTAALTQPGDWSKALRCLDLIASGHGLGHLQPGCLSVPSSNPLL